MAAATPEQVDKFGTNLDRQDRMVNGDEMEEVETDNGPVPSWKKFLKTMSDAWTAIGNGFIATVQALVNAASTAATSAGVSQTAAAASASVAQTAAAAATLSTGLFATSAAGVNTALGVGARVGGGGGTNGTFSLPIPAPGAGGTQAVATITVAGGILTGAALSVPGSNYTADVVFNNAALAALSAGLAGASLTLSCGKGAAFGSFFSVPVAAGTNDFLILYQNVAGVAAEINRYPNSTAASSAGGVFDLTFSRGGYRFAIMRGRRVIFGIRDDEKWTIDLKMPNVLNLFGGQSIDPSGSSRQWLYLIQDPAKRVLFGINSHGWPVFKEHLLAMNAMVDTGTSLLYSRMTGFKYQVFIYDKTADTTTQLTTVGNNINPRLSFDGKSVIFATDRNGSYESYLVPKNGGAETKIFPTDIVLWGNSLSSVSTGYASFVVGLNGAHKVSVQGIWGQTSAEILARMVGCSFVVAGNTIPASGGVGLTFTTVSPLRSGIAEARSMFGTITPVSGAPIPGALSYSSGGAYTFTRSNAGAITAVPNPAVFTPTSGFVEGTTDPTGADNLEDLLRRIAIFWICYNDIRDPAYSQTATLANLAAAVAARRSPTQRYLVVGETMGEARLTSARSPVGIVASDAESDRELGATVSLNAAEAGIYGTRFVDLQANFVALGLTNSFTPVATAYDVVNRTALGDGAHPLPGTGGPIEAAAVQVPLTTFGWSQ